MRVIIFLFVFASYAFFVSHGGSGNLKRQMALIRSMADDGTLDIEKYKKDAVDVAVYKGRTYSAGEPGMSFLGLPVYLLYSKACRVFKIQKDSHTAVYLIRVFTVSLPSACLAALLYSFLMQMPGAGGYLPLLLALIYSVGSPAAVYSTLFYRHQLTAVLCFSVFYLVFMMKQEHFNNRRVFLAGMLTSLCFLCDNVSAPALFYMFIYFMLNLDKRSRLTVFLLGMAPFMIAYFGYNAACFDNPLKGGFSYTVFSSKENAGKNIFNFALFLFQKPRLDELYWVTFSHYRGLFYYFPLAAVPFLGFYTLWRKKELRQEVAVCALVVLSYIYITSLFGDWVGALGSVTRHLILTLPFFMPLLALSCTEFKVLFAGLSVYSLLMSFVVNISVAGEAPGELSAPMSFFLMTERNGFFRATVLDGLGVFSPLMCVVIYAVWLLAASAFLLNAVKKYQISLSAP